MVTISNSINNTVGASNSGVTNTLTITNPSDTASSSAQQLITVGGTSAGDAWIQWSVGTTRSYALGIDNTDSDFFKMTTAASGTIDPSSGTEFFTHDPVNGIINLLNGTSSLNSDTTNANLLVVGKKRIGGLVTNTFSNGGAGANSHASIQILSIGAGSTGDTFFRLVTSAAQWQFGQDFSDSGAFVINHGVSDILDQTTFQKITAVGEVTFPLTPAFSATHSVAQNNVTGAGTAVTVNFTTEIFDQNADYDGTNTFTASVAGRYRFNVGLRCADLGAANTAGTLQIVTSNRTYESFNMSYAAIRGATNIADFSFSILADMDAGDTCHIISLITSGAGDTVDLPAGVTTSFFAGELVA